MSPTTAKQPWPAADRLPPSVAEFELPNMSLWAAQGRLYLTLQSAMVTVSRHVNTFLPQSVWSLLGVEKLFSKTSRPLLEYIKLAFEGCCGVVGAV